MKQNTLAAWLLILSLAPLPLQAEQAADAKTSSLSLVLKETLRLAHEGDPQAQYVLGLFYEAGQERTRDIEKAIAWYEKAAAQGYGKAMVNLGAIYHKGKGVERDPEKARYWYEKAAAKGIAKAQYNLALLYASRPPEERDLQQSFRWFTLAARQGHAWAQMNLGIMYAEGYGTERDDGLAVFWEALAAQQGVEPARKRVEEYVQRLPRLRIHRTRVNIRIQPDLQAEIIDRRNAGDIVYRLGESRDGQWYEIYLPEGHLIGYVAAFLAEEAD
ncbi:SH3 domain-containing protein [endosymbiont of unidentified scaly snail isolate Monju]|uniref:SH3 domain-containing protein n=1 Tax=endosymbiont of unidentified scaly snail isolate Monju TaxID=1248727 RepID=UPI0003892B5F|nr:SH3 domain-containing protein [endosymbiont of unidentified scaly snail isolate Monju]BAN68568.1 hypothetical protein EBS_0606 [endosymbiont of unidentified scaly snail isolate Monju]